MTISDRLFNILQDKNMTQAQLARLTGISTRTINAWHKLGTNPGADKIMIICEVLDITPEMLLTGKDIDPVTTADFANNNGSLMERQLVSDYRELSEDKRRRLMAYLNMLINMKE